jgi:hypothetical protein
MAAALSRLALLGLGVLRRTGLEHIDVGQLMVDWLAHVFWVLADMEVRPCDVRFTPESGHWLSMSGCPLCANSGHRPLRRGPAAITKSNNKKRFDPALCDSPELIELSP